MANWISSKLKAAETILQQIDQQAAESLRKNEKFQTLDEVFETPSKTGSPVSLKGQLRKKTNESSDYDDGSQRNSFEQSSSFSSSPKTSGKPDKAKERANSTSLQKPTLTDSDWTELLSTPNQGTSTARVRTINATSGVRGLKKDGKKYGSLGSKRNDHAVESRGRLRKLPNGKPNNGEGSSSSSGVGTPKDAKTLSEGLLEHAMEDSVRSADRTLLPQESLTDVGKEVNQEVSESTVSKDLKRKEASVLSMETDSDSESDSSTDSERERAREERRMMREKIFAEKVAAKAVDSIKERENTVARLEGEKQSLEKILEERAKQQAQEASELQTTMMETMEAVEVEKQKHNNTRMQVLTRLAGLETANADLARSLAAGQKKLETQVEQVAEFRAQVELKESALDELERKMLNIHQKGKYFDQMGTSRGARFEHEMLEAECSLLSDKIGRMNDKAHKLEADIEMMRKEIEEPTEVEIELKHRLDQLTDHLIQKQSQVEALSSEKATLLFRIEAVSRLLEESKGMSETSWKDLESGEWGFSESKLRLRPGFQERLRSGKQHLGWMVLQLNAIFMSGAVFLRRNQTAKMSAALYLLCLHLWVLYILFSHSDSPSSEAKSGAVISLQNFGNHSGQ